MKIDIRVFGKDKDVTPPPTGVPTIKEGSPDVKR